MKLAFLSIACMILSPCLARAGCGVTTSAYVAPVTYAYAIGIPVATVAPFGYVAGGTDPNLVQVIQNNTAAMNRMTAAMANGGGFGARAANPFPYLGQSCTSCHTTNQAAMQAVNMTDLSALTCEQKLDCIDAIRGDRMPKGKPITDPNLAGNLIGELSAKRGRAPIVQSRPAVMPGMPAPPQPETEVPGH